MKADLHVHSIYSNHPSDWFLQRIGAGESYSQPETIYQQAKSRGMDFVTISDHNKINGSLELVKNHPEDCFTGVESTAYFPEDGCKIHILIYGFSEKQFEKIEKKRKNIYQLRDWLLDRKLPHAVAHPVHSVNKRLTPEHFEKLILLFNVFEGLNGQKGQFGNEETVSILENLDPPTIMSLVKKHGIEPVGKEPWKKSLIGGSDDRAGLFIGKTFTEIKAKNISEFVDKIRKGKVKVFGRHNNFQALAFTVYKVAWEYSEHKSGKFANNLIKNINNVIFESGNLSLSSKLKLTGYKLTIKEEDIISRKIIELIEDLERTRNKDPEKRIDQVFRQISELSDAIIENLVSYLIENVQNLNLINAFTRLMTMLPTVFLAAPFVTALSYLYTDRKLIMSLGNHLESNRNKRKDRILWFSDTIDDLNGVSETLKELDKWIEEKDLDIKIATCVSDQDDRSRIPKNLIEFEKIMDFRPEYYKTYVLKVPSFLKSLKVIQEFNPDVIYLSTPGFIGLLGMAAARLMHIPTYGIFHTDFVGQMGDIAQDEALNENTRTYINWFYSSCDFIASPTKSYVPILEGYGFPKEKMKLFRRWIDCSIFRPIENAKEKVYEKYDLPEGPLMLFTGRISRDKNLDLSIDVFNGLKKEFPSLSYLILGFGPYADELKEKTVKIEGIKFPGKVERNELPEIYSAADLFIFPSVNDTFGLSVLESQACGLPCFVTKVGGPAEIIEHEKSGFILDSGPAELWIEKIREFLNNPNNRMMRENAVKRAKSNYDIHEVLNKLIIDI